MRIEIKEINGFTGRRQRKCVSFVVLHHKISLDPTALSGEVIERANLTNWVNEDWTERKYVFFIGRD